MQHRWQPGWSNECKWRFIGTTNVHNGLRAAAWGTGTPEVFIAAATSEYYTQPSARAGEFRVPRRSPPEARDDDSGGRHRRSGASRSGRVDGRPHNTDKPRRSHVSPKHRRKKRSRCGLLSVKNLEMSRHTRRRGDVRQKDSPPLAGGRPSRERRPPATPWQRGDTKDRDGRPCEALGRSPLQRGGHNTADSGKLGLARCPVPPPLEGKYQ